MSQISYQIVSKKSHVTLIARSMVHDVEITSTDITGAVTGNPADLQGDTAMNVELRMKGFDAGDWLKNRKLGSYLEIKKHPTATFKLASVSNATHDGDGYNVTVKGDFDFMGRHFSLEFEATGTADAKRVVGDTEFSIYLPDIGLKPPQFMFVKMGDTVRVKVHIEAVTG